MRIAVTGHAGQVVRALRERAGDDEVIALGRPVLDLARLETIAPAITAAITAARADVVINAAAYTAVDRAESEAEAAFAVNAAGAGEVARVSHELGLPMIQISTDYVFDGSKTTPWLEGDPVGPLGVYGASKLAGERAVLAAHADAVIVRTSWVYAPFGANFVKTMLHLAETRDEVSVVADQFGCPTNALDLADGLLAMARALVRQRNGAPRGIFHLAGAGEASWAQFAEAVFAASAAHGGPAARVSPITTAQYPTLAARPANSRLNCDAAVQSFGVGLPDWRISVAQVVRRLIAQKEQGI